jgi:hypothetical protein
MAEGKQAHPTARLKGTAVTVAQATTTPVVVAQAQADERSD